MLQPIQPKSFLSLFLVILVQEFSFRKEISYQKDIIIDNRTVISVQNVVDHQHATLYICTPLRFYIFSACSCPCMYLASSCRNNWIMDLFKGYHLPFEQGRLAVKLLNDQWLLPKWHPLMSCAGPTVRHLDK